ncbi:MAG: alpha/beta hydrolase [Ruminococcus sp.]|nr:alpha/beta hydrolase [Ruminococcus sp.]
MAAIIHQIVYKIISIFMAISIMFGGTGGFIKSDSSKWNTNYRYVFVHGLSGWGSYDSVNKIMPYWGMFGGDLMEYLHDKGFDCYAASVSPSASAWDRACELYAQLTGTMVDYGKEHSERCGHSRYGTDYTNNALIEAFSEKDKINLLGHSFGGATVRLFASIMENGSESEINATDENELSDFFKGGKGDWIYSITTLAAPHNGTTAYSVGENDSEKQESDSAESNNIKTKFEGLLSGLISSATGGKEDGRVDSDYASYDMYIDNALALNDKILTLKNTYYFSFACCSTYEDENGNHVPYDKKTEALFRNSSREMGQYTGVTQNGYVIDESWKMNDGLVNTKSALYPIGAPNAQFDENNITPGTWNVMPIYDGDHMSLQGGLTKTNDVKPFYTDLLSMINSIK